MTAVEADMTAVTQLVLRERQGRDRGWWQRMRDSLAPDARVAISWFRGSGEEFVTASEAMAKGGTQAVHRMGPPVVDVAGDRAVVEAPAAICLRLHLDAVEADLTSHTRLLYRAERRAGRWWLTALDPVYAGDTLSPVVPGEVPRLDRDRLAAHRPSYRFLGYCLEEQGHPVARDLHGDDRPEGVAALLADAYAWLRAA
ncbi:nuclear transport factor 2 family protein [Streptomyces sp. NPDC059740]|uniref:nuclear transport factor 2 family protein n=1 Tax=Streptomyces sp. NPDC059740 TaxID=3346926 RepID=UPI00364AF6F1